MKITPKYCEHPLPLPLAAYVKCVWFLRTGPRDPGAPAERVFPDGCVEMIVQLDGERGVRASNLPGGESRLQPAAFLIGPLASPLFLEPLGPMRTLGVRFRPGAAARFLPFPVDVLARAGEEAPVSLAFGAAGVELAERLAGPRSHLERVALVEAFLRQRLAAAPSPRGRRRGSPGRDLPVAFAVSRMLAARRFPVARLARDCGWSPRQLERRFRAETGLTPRLLARIIRFQRVFRALGDSGAGAADASRGRAGGDGRDEPERTKIADWITLALDCGYSDQAHLIRDFREFSGETPAAFLRSSPGLAAKFVAPERLERFFGGAGKGTGASHSFNTDAAPTA